MLEAVDLDDESNATPEVLLGVTLVDLLGVDDELGLATVVTEELVLREVDVVDAGLAANGFNLGTEGGVLMFCECDELPVTLAVTVADVEIAAGAAMADTMVGGK